MLAEKYHSTSQKDILKFVALGKQFISQEMWWLIDKAV